MNGIHEKHHVLQNAIEALVTHTGDDRQRAMSAVNEITSLKAADFPEHLETSFFDQVSGFARDLRAGRISDENLRRLKGNLWALYKSVSVSRDRLFQKME